MGAWGAGLYQDDVTCDIKSDYLNRLKIGYSNKEATEEVIEYNEDFIDDEDDEPLFWFALADIQWKYGRLLPKVKKEALKHLKAGKDLERWEENPRLYSKRKEVLKKLEEQLLSPQPAEKKVGKITMRRSHWNIGDVLLYKLETKINNKKNLIDIKLIEEENKFIIDNGYNGKYILLKVIGLDKNNIGSLPRDKYYNEYAIVAIYDWVGDEIPNIDIIDNLELLKDINNHERLVRFAPSLTKKEIKELNIQTIKKAQNPKKEYMTIQGGLLYSSIYNINYFIIRKLEENRSK